MFKITKYFHNHKCSNYDDKYHNGCILCGLWLASYPYLIFSHEECVDCMNVMDFNDNFINRDHFLTFDYLYID